MSTNLLLNVWALPNKFKIIYCVIQMLLLGFFTAVENANVIPLIITRKENVVIAMQSIIRFFFSCLKTLFPWRLKNVEQIIAGD